MLANIPRFETMNKNRRVPSSLFKASFIASLAAIPPRSGRTLIVGATHRKPRRARVLPSTRGRCRWSAARWMIASIRYERNQLKKRLTVPQQENILRDKDSRPRNANQKDGGVGILLHSVWAVLDMHEEGIPPCKSICWLYHSLSTWTCLCISCHYIYILRENNMLKCFLVSIFPERSLLCNYGLPSVVICVINFMFNSRIRVFF